MANRYKLTVSAPGQKIVYAGTEIDLRFLDLTMLENLFHEAANTKKVAKEINLCVILAERIKALHNTAETEFIIDDLDKANLETGIETTVNRRPLSWYASKLWKQFDSPEKIND